MARSSARSRSAELAHVAQQLGLRAMRVKHRMGEERACALQLRGQRLGGFGFDLRVSKLAAECAPHRLDHGRRRGLVERDAERAARPIRRLIFSTRARSMISPCFSPVFTVTVSKNASDRGAKPKPAQPRRQHGGAAMHRARDVGQSFRPVIDRVHRGDDGQQHLRGADVGGRFLAADVLLAGLQRQPIGRLLPRIDRQAHDAPRQRPLQRIAHRHVGRVRPAISHRHAKALRRSDRDVGTEFAGRGQQCQA